MKSILTFLIFISLTVALASFSGCSNVETADAGKKEQADSAGDSPAVKKDSKLDPVGEWKLDVEETINANGELLRTPGLDVNDFKRSIRGMILDFLIEPDNTFFCYEKADGLEADYSGTWELNGNRIEIHQKIRDDRKEKDELAGTIEGDRMDLVHKQQGVSVNLVVTR